ncbi:MAG: NAD(P)-dependent oxidoreductase [Polyangiaceae bacterium]
MSEPATILVTGAAGFMGRHLLRSVARSKNQARWCAVDLAPPERWWDTPEDFQFVRADCADLGECEQLLREHAPSAVVHLAGVTRRGASSEERELLFRSNLVSTCNMLKALSRSGAAPTHFVLASSGLTYGNQPSPFTEALPAIPVDDYSMCKMLAEQAVLSYARAGLVRACILRPAVVYGPGQSGDMFVPAMLGALRAGRRFAMTAGKQTRDFIYIEDVVKAMALVVERGLEGTYNIGTGEGIAMRDVAELVARLLHCPGLLGIGDLPYREREVWAYALDPSRLRAEGWQPHVSIEEGLRRTLDWGESPVCASHG